LGIQRKERTELVDIIFTLPHLARIEKPSNLGLLPHSTMAFRQNNELVSRDVIFLDCFADDFLAHAVRIYVCRVPGVESFIVSGFEEG
jgi:hypothetical protein